MIKKSYNPFLMFGTYLGAILLFLIILILGYQIIGTLLLGLMGFDVNIFQFMVMLLTGISPVGFVLPALLLGWGSIFLGALIGWGIHSLFRSLI